MNTAPPITTTSTRRFAGLAADDAGRNDDRAPLLLLHGLTFDRTVWRGIIAELHRVDPDRRVVSLDLPGHGESPEEASYDLEPVAARIRDAVADAGLDAPVVVGHSLAAGIASVYAAHYPTRGVVNVDSSPVLAPVVGLIRSMADRLRGPEFATLWLDVFYASFHVELLRPEARSLVADTCRPHQSVVLGYWRSLLEDPLDELTALIDRASAAVAAAGIPYFYISGTELDPGTRAWMAHQPFTPTVEVWPETGHFPHLAHAARFAGLLAAVDRT